MADRQKTAKNAAIACIAIAVAYACSMLEQFEIGGQTPGFIRVLIYLAMFIVWIIRVNRTVQQQATKKYLLIIGILMVFWLYIRSIKLEFALSLPGMRICWYLYYLPMLFIPVAALLAALTIGKADGERLSSKTAVFWIVSAGLLMLVLTNDFNQLVFVFPENVPPALRSDSIYSYGPVYFVVVGWMLALGIAALAVMYVKCRLPHLKRIFWISLVPIAIALLYTVLYCIGFEWLRFWLGDMTVVHCLLFTATLEWCIMCGMIRSNTGYKDLFEISFDCSAQIADQSFCIRYRSGDAQPVTGAQIRKALQSPFATDDGKVLHAMKIRGGYAVWTEDISDLLAQEEELRILQEELQERNELLRSEYMMEEKRRKVEEQNRLYDLLQEVTQKQLDRIALLVQEYQWQEKNSEAAGTILAKITVLCSYIKRRRHLELIADRDFAVPARELEMAFSESLRALELLGVTSSLFVDVEKQLAGSDAVMLYGFFENVIESDMEKLHSLYVRTAARNEGLRITITAESDADLSGIRKQYPDAEFERYDDEQTCMLVLRKRGEC